MKALKYLGEIERIVAYHFDCYTIDKKRLDNVKAFPLMYARDNEKNDEKLIEVLESRLSLLHDLLTEKYYVPTGEEVLNKMYSPDFTKPRNLGTTTLLKLNNEK